MALLTTLPNPPSSRRPQRLTTPSRQTANTHGTRTLWPKCASTARPSGCKATPGKASQHTIRQKASKDSSALPNRSISIPTEAKNLKKHATTSNTTTTPQLPTALKPTAWQNELSGRSKREPPVPSHSRALRTTGGQRPWPASASSTV